MSLATGTKLGPYEIVSPLGAGGMGEVYKATDSRLNRTVAIKVLPPHFAHNPEMKQRFDREAQTIAGLNHPHICTLHDVGEQDGVSFLVMEHLEGETLAARLTRGPLPIDEALRVAREILDGLDTAHRQGVVHRDLKPQNVMLTRGGTARPGAAQAKLLDFGLAKWAASGQPGSLSAMPTRAEVTSQGTIIGTLQYMAPEQVEGKEADARTDIFAFGAVLYEMVTGKKAFEGKSQASLIGAIMKAEPRPISHAQPLTPAALDHIVARCLAKDPDDRWQDTHSLMIQLGWITRNRTGTAVTAAPPRRRVWLDRLLAGGVVVLLAAVSLPAYLYFRGQAEPEALQFRNTIVGLSPADISLSPDGRTIAFVAKPDTGAATLYVRPVGAVASVKIPGTDNASLPFWSPDSKFIAYVTGDKLKKVEAAGGAAQDVCDAPGFSGGAWSTADGGTILFGSAKGVKSVSAEGGNAAPITELGQKETGHFWPSFLPDGRHFLYLAWSADVPSRAVYVGTPARRRRSGSSPRSPLRPSPLRTVPRPGTEQYHAPARRAVGTLVSVSQGAGGAGGGAVRGSAQPHRGAQPTRHRSSRRRMVLIG